jgi:hypothetical protein
MLLLTNSDNSVVGQGKIITERNGHANPEIEGTEVPGSASVYSG